MALDQEALDRRVARVLEHVRLENAHDFPACIAVFDRPRYEIVPTNQIYPDAAGVESFQDENRQAFPDFRFEARRVVAAGDVVLAEGSFTGTHEGTWNGLPATGRKVNFPMAVVFEFEGDALVCERVYFDLGTPLKQLGVARDPLSLGGRITTVLNHPITLIRAVIHSLRRRPRD